jgi:hypothetical protein
VISSSALFPGLELTKKTLLAKRFYKKRDAPINPGSVPFFDSYLTLINVTVMILQRKVRVVVVTRPIEDFQGKETTALQGSLDLLKDAGVTLVYRSNIHQKFAVMEQRILWYGSINLLSFGNAEESIMRLDSPNIAYELIKSIER